MTPTTASNIKQNQIPAAPNLRDALDLHTQEVLLAANCHAIGTVQAFDPSTQLAQVTINYQKTYFEYDEETQVYNSVLVPYPLLLDIPVVNLYGGLQRATFPIAIGDQGLVCFNDRDLDNWLSGSNTSAVATPRLHSFSDGIIIVGLRSNSTALKDYDPFRIHFGTSVNYIKIGDPDGGEEYTIEIASGTKVSILFAGGTVIEVAELIKIGNATTSLGAILTQLMTALDSAGAAFAGNASTEPAAAAGGAILSAISTTLQTLITELLE